MTRQIKPVTDNLDKQRTYAENIRRYNKAMKEGFYFEALLIDYAMIEDRLRSFIYHIGGLKTRDEHKISKGYAKNKLSEIVEKHKVEGESKGLGITSLSGKMKIVRATLIWSTELESTPDDKYLRILKSQYEGQLDIGGILDTLEKIREWCDYRNEVIHALMNKSVESVDERIADQAAKGMVLARYLDSQVKNLKKGNRIRRSLGYKEQ